MTLVYQNMKTILIILTVVCAAFQTQAQYNIDQWVTAQWEARGEKEAAQIAASAKDNKIELPPRIITTPDDKEKWETYDKLKSMLTQRICKVGIDPKAMSLALEVIVPQFQTSTHKKEDLLYLQTEVGLKYAQSRSAHNAISTAKTKDEADVAAFTEIGMAFMCRYVYCITYTMEQGQHYEGQDPKKH